LQDVAIDPLKESLQMGSEFEDEIFEGLRAAMNALKIKNTVVLR
jgi:hypothetical protein